MSQGLSYSPIKEMADSVMPPSRKSFLQVIQKGKKAEGPPDSLELGELSFPVLSGGPW